MLPVAAIAALVAGAVVDRGGPDRVTPDRQLADRSGGDRPEGVPQPILDLDGDDALFSGTDLTSWPARIGPTAQLIGGCGAPQDGPSANGHNSVDFIAANATVLNLGSLQSAAEDLTIVRVSDNPCAAGDGSSPCDHRQYWLRSTVTIDSNDLAFAHLANYGAGFAFPGYFDGSINGDTDPNNGWHWARFANFRSTLQLATAVKALHVETWRCSAADGCSLYRDGVLVGTNAAFTRRVMTALRLGGTHDAGGTCTASVAANFEGNLYRVKIYRGAQSPGFIVAEQQALMARYGITAWPPSTGPTPESIFGGALIARYTASDAFYLEYDANRNIQVWANHANTGTHLATANLTNNIAYRREDPDAGRYPSVKTSHAITTEAVLTANSVASTLFPGGVATGATTAIFVFHQCTGGGEGSNDGPLAAFGNSASNTARYEFDYKSSATTRSLVIALSDASSNRNVQPTNDLGTTIHLRVDTQDEGTDVATTQIDGGTVNTGSTVNNGTTTLNTFTIGARKGTTFTGGGAGCYRLMEVIIVQGLITSQQRIDTDTFADAWYGT